MSSDPVSNRVSASPSNRKSETEILYSIGQSMEQGIKQSIEGSALRYLGRRDYSRLELYQRLISKGYQSALINPVLDSLQQRGYQSDERFAESYIRSRVRSGDGPFKIKIALRGKGICDSLTLAIIDKLNIDWFEQVRAVKHKHFGEIDSGDINETAQQARYLRNKGFYQEHIQAVIAFN